MTATEREATFEEWMRDHHGILYKVARSFTEAAAEQEDLAQEIRIAVWNGIPHFNRRCKPSSYIYRIALNRAISWRRGKRNYQNKLDAYQRTLPETGGRSTQDDLRLDLVYAEIRKLNEAERALILLQFDGFSYREIAETLGITESNVGVRLNRIKSKLTERLKGAQN